MEKCIQDSVEQVLAQANWDEKMVPQWINDICEKSMKQLLELNRPYKFLSKQNHSSLIEIFSSHMHADAEDPNIRSLNCLLVQLGK